ncbi:Xylose isomerase [Acididesulfobacillus acetoxydans]|uniref:Xylose isomerase n=1 Tax=Acididesulfobacillus acetoxydans TaxID=1561005 RepID=A0A8S0W9H5_9FIRM|nr:xylose isomerase [Acididesulfobacillus acetoxydans]CAA7602609.1 Xylose isomerase [Acididesulfobacillus acetoxydans]CEJ07244.1 Xylose isomerase [Acididesulfobacillus acetoxydans]
MQEVFKGIPMISYEGRESQNPLAFKHYNPEEMIGDKSMREHLRFSVAVWHTFTGKGIDPFGSATVARAWDKYPQAMDQAKARMEAAFEFFAKLGVPYFCFHDRDIAPEGGSLAETNKNLLAITDYIKELMQGGKVKLLWGTANLFAHPRFVHGAATSPNADVFAYAAAQVKKAMEVTLGLGGENYVFWGGREGYETLLNTDMELEVDNLARFFRMAVDYAKEIGFSGQLLIEPKPKEPTKHQYDFDVASVLAFLRKYGLDKDFKVNIEANHATLAGHTFQHELHYARINGVLGSVDANQGDELLGWDTDQFPTNLYSTTLAMYEILKNGGLHKGGLNFDAKARRGSFTDRDLFEAHIAGMDAFAIGLKAAYKLLKSGVLEKMVEARYSSYRQGIGQKIRAGNADFRDLEEYALTQGDIRNESGQQETLESILNQYILQA